MVETERAISINVEAWRVTNILIHYRSRLTKGEERETRHGGMAIENHGKLAKETVTYECSHDSMRTLTYS